MLSLLFVVLKPYVCRLENDHYDNLHACMPITDPTETYLQSTIERLRRRKLCDGATAPISKVERHIGIVPYFGAVGTPVRPRRCGRK